RPVTRASGYLADRRALAAGTRAAPQHLAHVIEIELVGLGPLHEVAKRGHDGRRVVELRPVAGAGDLDEPAVRDLLVGLAPVLDGDDAVLGPPDEERGHSLGQVKAIRRA